MSKNIATFTDPEIGQVEIRRLNDSQADAETYAKPFQDVLLESWGKRFTEEVFPPMASIAQIKQRFDPESVAKVLAQQTAIQLASRESATYYTAEIHAESDIAAIIGLAKVIRYKPDSKIKSIAGFNRYPYPYIHDVDVRPAYQKHGVGSALMLTMLKGYGANKPVSLYAYEGNAQSIDWFEELGFEPKDETNKRNLLGEGTFVDEIHFEAPAVNGVRAAIIAKQPNLEKLA